MSVYRPKGSPFYHYDFQMRGRRFHGSTGRKSRRDAEAVEQGERERAKELMKIATGGVAALSMNAAAGRYWQEVGRHHADHDGTWRNLERLVGYFGKDKLLKEIGDADVTVLVAWRRGNHIRGDRQRPLVTNATVNRSTTEVLQKLFTRAKQSWGMRFENEPHWKTHRLWEPGEHVRELKAEEAGRIDAVMRSDYEPYFSFARETGQRLRECMLRWCEVDWGTAQIIKKGKKGRTIVIPITSTIKRILWQLRGHHSAMVFTYIARRTRGTIVKGQRYPITYSGIKTEWRRLRSRAQIEGFRFHDFRHDFGTKLLRQTGNLKLVQKALNHADIKTTTRYAHVLTEEVAEALETLQKSRNKSRIGKRKAS